MTEGLLVRDCAEDGGAASASSPPGSSPPPTRTFRSPPLCPGPYPTFILGVCARCGASGASRLPDGGACRPPQASFAASSCQRGGLPPSTPRSCLPVCWVSFEASSCQRGAGAPCESREDMGEAEPLLCRVVLFHVPCCVAVQLAGSDACDASAPAPEAAAPIAPCRAASTPGSCLCASTPPLDAYGCVEAVDA